MPLERTLSADSICSVLSCTSEEFNEMYDRSYSTDILSEEALLNIIKPRRVRLREAHKRYRLDDLLSAMLEYAPDEVGKRYVAVALHIAHKKGDAAVIDIAKSWMDYLFLPVLTVSANAAKVEPSSSQTPSIDITAEHIEVATRSAQGALRKLLAIRERHHCAITGTLDAGYVQKLEEQGLDDQVPDETPRRMAAAHIIPFSLNEFDEKELKDVGCTWDMLTSWTNIDIQKLTGDKINSPENAIFMTTDDRLSFGRFRFYFDKEVYPTIPNKYRVRMARRTARLSNGQTTVDVEFRTQDGISPPDPEFLRVHAAFARVLHLCGAAEYVDSIERSAESDPALCQNSPMDFASMLRSRLVILQYSNTPILHTPSISYIR